MPVRLQDLGPAAQRQAIEKLHQLEQERKKARAGPKIGAPDEGSKLEQEYYMAFIWPRELAGEIDHV